jgi:hypothetical protein
MYQLTSSECILRLSDGAAIPPDPANTDYAAYLAWVEEGNTPLPAEGTEPEAEEETVLIRARNELGQYVGDDPDTPDVNEAWTEVPLEDA